MQTEPEARTVKWGATEKFGNFLLVLQHFRYLQMPKLWFLFLRSPGKSNPANFMSRNPLGTESSYLDKATNKLEESIIKMVKTKDDASTSNNLIDATKKGKMIMFLK